MNSKEKAESEFKFREVFNPKLVQKLSKLIKVNYSNFDSQNFESDIFKELENLSYGDRAKLIRDNLYKYLPKEFPKAVQILIKSLPPEPKSSEIKGFEGFIIMPLCLYVAKYGLNNPDLSLNALYEFTKRFTAEGEIRVFLQKYPQKTYQFLEKITQDKSPFARRLASEGTRPRLPLSSRLKAYQKDPTPVIKLLDKLKADPNEMVRRSVANNLNDIAKDNPEIVVKTLERWQQEGESLDQKHINHALRTLIKKGYRSALKFLGYQLNPKLKITNFDFKEDSIQTGDYLEFKFQVENKETKNIKILVDYLIDFKKKKGHSAKEFKLTKKELSPGEILTISKKHSFKAQRNRVFYTGTHFLIVQINGKQIIKRKFQFKS